VLQHIIVCHLTKEPQEHQCLQLWQCLLQLGAEVGGDCIRQVAI
jgi:hypothetical protein